MSRLDKHALLELEVLKQVEESPLLTTRKLADKLGVSVKLAHAVLSGMVERGLFHIKKHHSRRWDYFLTPGGISEKARLTYEFLNFSMQFYHEARKRSSQVCRDIAEAGGKEVAIAGTGELAEIAYLGIKEWNLKLSAVYSDTHTEFLGEKCCPLKEIKRSGHMPLIICFYDRTQPMKEKFLAPDVQRMNNMRWIF